MALDFGHRSCPIEAITSSKYITCTSQVHLGVFDCKYHKKISFEAIINQKSKKKIFITRKSKY